MKLKILGLLGALIFAAPVAAIAAPAGGLTAESAAPALVTPAVDTNAAVTPGTSAKIEKVWWRRGWGGGWRGGWRGYGWRGYGFRGYYGGWRRPYGWGWRRRYWW